MEELYYTDMRILTPYILEFLVNVKEILKTIRTNISTGKAVS